jgi:hypothetical protein
MQRSRTPGEIPIEVTLLEAVEPPLYQQIARNALELHQLGLSLSAIAGRLCVADNVSQRGIASDAPLEHAA